MSFLACFYLFLGDRPLLSIAIICGGFPLLVVSFTEGEIGFVGWALLFPWTVGWCVGGGLGGTMQRSFIWTLPGWRRRLVTGALVSGVAVASLSTTAVPWLGPPWILFPLMILLYFAGAYVGNNSAIPGRPFLNMGLNFVPSPMFWFFGDEVVAFCVHHPALTLARWLSSALLSCTPS